MSQQFSNAARTELAAGILAGDTTFALADGQVFPDANNGNAAIGTGTWFKATLQDPDGIEIVYVRTHNTGTTPNGVSHVLRGQEGTVARAFAAGTAIGLRVTAGDMANLWATMATKAPTSHTHTIAHVTGLQSALDGKATDSVALTEAAGTSTLPATSSATVASRLQALRNNVKQAFADLGNKLNTDFASLTTRTIDGTETLAFSGGLKATVQAVLNWMLGRANTWTGTQTFNKAVFTPTAVLTDTRAAYAANTWYAMPGTAPAITSDEHATYIAELHVQHTNYAHHQYTGSCTLSTVGWKASGSVLETSFALEQHDGNSITAGIRPTVSNGARTFEFRFGGNIPVTAGGFVRLTLLRLI